MARAWPGHRDEHEQNGARNHHREEKREAALFLRCQKLFKDGGSAPVAESLVVIAWSRPTLSLFMRAVNAVQADQIGRAVPLDY